MEEQCNTFNWSYCYQIEDFDEFKHSSVLLHSTNLELEASVISAHEEISRKNEEILQLKSLIESTIKERDEFRTKKQKLLSDRNKLLINLQQKADFDENNNSVPKLEKGKFLQAVIEAGPLLQTLLLAGSMPRWQNPPPQIDSLDIPTVTISSPITGLMSHQDSVAQFPSFSA